MSQAHYKYILVGGGVAAEAAAEAIRGLDKTSPLLMVAKEPNRPYDRRAVSKRVVGRGTSVAEFLRPAEWFPDHAVELRTGRRVAHIETGRQSVTLDSGQDVGYDALLLATGASPAKLDVPGASLPNLFYLRNLADADRLGHAADVSRAAGLKSVVVVGGGLLGTEVSQTLAGAGFVVTWVVGRSHPWRRFAGDAVGNFVADGLRGQGVEVLNHRRAVGLSGNGRVQRVELDDGSLASCDFAVACVGSVVDRDLLRGTPLRAETAVLIDDRCRTVDPRVWAAGDCSAVFDPAFGKHRVVDHWDHAVATGTVAGTNMAGGDCRYAGSDRYQTTVAGKVVTACGQPRLVYRHVVEQTPGGFIEWGVAVDDRLAAAVFVGPAAGVEERVRRRDSVGPSIAGGPQAHVE